MHSLLGKAEKAGRDKEIGGLGIYRSSRGGVWLSYSWITGTEPPLLCQMQRKQANQDGKEYPESTFLSKSLRERPTKTIDGGKIALTKYKHSFYTFHRKTCISSPDRNNRIDSFTALLPKTKLQNQKEQVIRCTYLLSIHTTTESLAYVSSNLFQLHLKLG